MVLPFVIQELEPEITWVSCFLSNQKQSKSCKKIFGHFFSLCYFAGFLMALSGYQIGYYANYLAEEDLAILKKENERVCLIL